MSLKVPDSLINKENVSISVYGPKNKVLVVFSDELRQELDKWPPRTNVVVCDNICNQINGFNFETYNSEELEQIYSLVFKTLNQEY